MMQIYVNHKTILFFFLHLALYYYHLISRYGKIAMFKKNTMMVLKENKCNNKISMNNLIISSFVHDVINKCRKKNLIFFTS